MKSTQGGFSKGFDPAAQRLGRLAMRFRGTADGDERKAIAKEYANEVRKLIVSGNWNDMPAPEDMLPDDCMPKEFFEYWEI